MRGFLILGAALAAALVSCSSADSSDSSDAEADASNFDAGLDADATCQDLVVDADILDGVVYGLPTAPLNVSSPVVTAQAQVTPSSASFQKQVGVLDLSPQVRDVQAILHILQPMGIPYAVTTSPKSSVQHDMAIFFPEAAPSNFAPDDITVIQNYIQDGGTLVIKYSDQVDLKTLGGVSGATFNPTPVHHFVQLTDAGKAEFPSLNLPEEMNIPLGGSDSEYLNTWSLQVDGGATNAVVLAEFDDGSPAIVKNVPQGGTGVVYTLGIDYRDVVLRSELGHALYAARGYIDLFEPGKDAWLLMIRDIYDARVRFGIRLSSAPRGLRSAVLFTHDLDWGHSYDNAIQFAQLEQDNHATGMYFIHTKYVTDSQDVAFFTPEREPQLAQLLTLGGRIGSHTVAHSRVLDTFPLGDGTESYPSYQPYNVSTTVTTGGTLFGELRVSKMLIDGALNAVCVPHESTTFRAGNLSYHLASPQTMERLGYRYDSTRAVGDVLSNFPFRAMTDWPDAFDTSVFEFPVTIEDELPPRLDSRVSNALAIITANADNGAPTTILIHPNVTDYKYAAEQGILAGLPSDIGAMSLEQFGDFWRARDSVFITDITYNDISKILRVTLSTTMDVTGLTLRVSNIVTGVTAPPGARFSQGATGGFVILPAMTGGTSVTASLTYGP